MKKKFVAIMLTICISCLPMTGCIGTVSEYLNYKHTEIPTVDLPKAPAKPPIKARVIKQNNNVYVGYNISDSMKLYEYLVRKDAYEEALIYRIEQSNKLIQDFGKAKRR